MYNILNLKNKNMSLFYSILILLILSLFITVISKNIENFLPFYKKFCDKNILCPTFEILFVRFLHYVMSLYFIFYYFLFNTKYDLYYLILYVSLIFHWIITNDCILSNWEMSYYEKKQEIGKKPLLHPHFRVFVGNYTDYLVLIQGIIMTFGFILVLKRFDYKYYNYLFGITVIILQTYLMLKDRINIFKK